MMLLALVASIVYFGLYPQPVLDLSAGPMARLQQVYTPPALRFQGRMRTCARHPEGKLQLLTDTTRKLATIVALDVAGFSARTEADEESTVAQVANLRPVVESIAKAHGGRVFNTAGDGFILEFASIFSAVGAALELADECRPRVRVGVHVGEVMVQPNGDLLGHGVNVAARLMAKAEPGSAIISADVCRLIRGPLAERFASRGTVQLDKMNETIEMYAPAHGSAPAAPSKATTAGARRWATPSPRLAAMIGVPLLLVIIAAVLWSRSGAPSSSATDAPNASIAVLPFENLSTDKDNAFFAVGIQDEILTRLAKIGALKVISRTSTLRLADIASRLGVTTPAIYAHFPEGRSGVVAAVELRALEALSGLFDHGVDGEPRKALLDGVREFVRLFESHSAYLRVMLLDFATPGGLESVTRHVGPPGEIELSGTLRPMHDRLTALIARTVGKPRSKVSSWTFFNAVLGATFINVLHPPPRDARGRAPFRLEAEVIALADDYLRRYLGG